MDDTTLGAIAMPSTTSRGSATAKGSRVTCDAKALPLRQQNTYIPLGRKHRLRTPGKVSLELIEVRSGSYRGEDDIVRCDDVHGRA